MPFTVGDQHARKVILFKLEHVLCCRLRNRVRLQIAVNPSPNQCLLNFDRLDQFQELLRVVNNERAVVLRRKAPPKEPETTQEKLIKQQLAAYTPILNCLQSSDTLSP